MSVHFIFVAFFRLPCLDSYFYYVNGNQKYPPVLKGDLIHCMQPNTIESNESYKVFTFYFWLRLYMTANYRRIQNNTLWIILKSKFNIDKVCKQLCGWNASVFVVVSCAENVQARDNTLLCSNNAVSMFLNITQIISNGAGDT